MSESKALMNERDLVIAFRNVRAAKKEVEAKLEEMNKQFADAENALIEALLKKYTVYTVIEVEKFFLTSRRKGVWFEAMRALHKSHKLKTK